MAPYVDSPNRFTCEGFLLLWKGCILGPHDFTFVSGLVFLHEVRSECSARMILHLSPTCLRLSPTCPRAGQNGDHEGRQMKAGTAKSRPEWRSQRETNEGRLGGSGRDFGDQQPNLWEVRTPIASSYLGKKLCCFWLAPPPSPRDPSSPPLDWQFLVPCLHCVANKLCLLFISVFIFLQK